MSSEPAKPRIGSLRVMIGVWLMLLSFAIALDHAKLKQIDQSAQARNESAALASTQAQVSALATELHTLTEQPHGLSEARFETARADWEMRLARLEAREVSAPATSDLQALQERVGALETRLTKSQRKVAARMSVPAGPLAGTAPPVSAEPPFTPLGVELRGGERFLSILPAGCTSLAQARVLRAGDGEGAWTLERLDDREAQFRVNGQLQRLTLPR